MIPLQRYSLVLAVYPNTRGFAFVVFEGPLSPVDWGATEVRGSRKHARCLARVKTILDRYRPDIVVIQDTSPRGTRRTLRIVKLNAAFAELAERNGIPVYAYSRADVQRAFAHLGVPNKRGLAEVIARHIPAFERHVPPPRKPWMSEDARMGLFEAAALAWTFWRSKDDA